MIFAALSALSVAFNSFAGGVASRALGVKRVVVVASVASFAVALVAVALEPQVVDLGGVLIGLVAGISGGLGILMSYRALAVGPIGPVSAVTACTALLVVATTGFVFEGSHTLWQIVAVSLCVVSVALVTHQGAALRVTPFTLVLAMAAGMIFGSFSLLMNLTTPEQGWWPLVAVRTGVVTVAVTVWVTRGRKSGAFLEGPVRGRAFFSAALAGSLDTAGNIFLILALRGENLASVAVVTSITPALTATLGWIFLAERLGKAQVLGLALAVVALGLAAL